MDILDSRLGPTQVPQPLPTVHIGDVIGIPESICQQTEGCMSLSFSLCKTLKKSFWEGKTKLNHCTLKYNWEDRLALLLPWDLGSLKALASWGKGEWRLETGDESVLEKQKDKGWAAPLLITQPVWTGLGQCCNSRQIFWIACLEVPISIFPSFLINFR